MSISKFKVLFHVTSACALIAAVGASIYIFVEKGVDEFFFVFFVLLISLPAFILLLIYLTPVYCEQAGCENQMKPLWSNVSKFEWTIYLWCERCGACSESLFTFKFGGPTDY